MYWMDSYTAGPLENRADCVTIIDPNALRQVGEFQSRWFHLTVKLAETISRACRRTAIADRLLNVGVNV